MWGDIAIAFLLAFITSFMMTPYTIKLAKKVGAVDIPKDSRRMHKKPMPRLRGISCHCGICSFSYLSYYHNEHRRWRKATIIWRRAIWNETYWFLSRIHGIGNNLLYR